MINILVFGDSNSHGTPPLNRLGEVARYDKADRWPEVMAADLGAGFDVVTDGLPGRTTVHDDPVEGGMRNGATVLPSALHSHKPLDLVIIMLGTNDLKTRFSVSAYEIARSVERLVGVTRAEDVAKNVMVVAPAPVRETGCLTEVFAGAEARQDGLTEMLRKMADALGIGFFDASSVARVSQIDGVHLDADQHHALGLAMAKAVREYIA